MRRPLRALALTAAAVLLATTWGAAPTTAQDPAPWGIMHFTMQGQPGDWVFLYHELPEPTHSVVYGVTYNFTSSAPDGVPYSSLVGVPRVTSEFFDQPMESMLAAMRLRDMPGGGALAKSYNGTEWASSSSDLTGIALLVGSTAAWNLTVTLTLDETRSTVAPDFVSTGHGMSRWAAADARPVAALAPQVGVLFLEANLTTPGWTHFHLEQDPVPAYGARFVSLEFPNHTQRGPAYRLPGSGLSDFFQVGVPLDTEGTFRARILRADEATIFRAVLVHLPMEPGDIPAELNPRPYAETP